jgi:hypothetical protein
VKIKFAAAIAVVALVFAGAAQAAGVLNAGQEGDPAETKEHALAQKLDQRTTSAPLGALARTRRGARGPRGPKGPAGAPGVPGAPGPRGTFGAITAVKGPSTFLCGWESGACSVGASTAQCPAGTTVVSGGYAGAGVRAFIDSPVPGGWYVGAANESALSTTFYAIALCAS